MVQMKKKKMKVKMKRAENRCLILTPIIETMLNMIPTMIDHHLLLTVKKGKVKRIEVSKATATHNISPV